MNCFPGFRSCSVTCYGQIIYTALQNFNPMKYPTGLERSVKDSKLLEAIQYAAQLMVILSFLVDSIIVGNLVMM